MKVDTEELVSAIDIAMMLGIGQSAISNWHKRHADFPQPVCHVSNGRTALWRRSDVLQWHRARMSDDEREAQVERVRAMLKALEE